MSDTTNAKAGKEDMRHLIQPRGPGKSWVFRMATPPDLTGAPNPWDVKSLKKEIENGPGTRKLNEARRLRDIAPGDMPRLEDSLRDGVFFCPASAIATRPLRPPRYVGIEPVLHGKL